MEYLTGYELIPVLILRINVIKRNAELAFRKLQRVPGLMPVMPQGAMYM